MKFKSHSPININNISTNVLLDYFVNTWKLTELLFSSIKKKDILFKKSDPLRNPLIFYLGHTAVFYINLFLKSKLISEGINSCYEKLFARGVDPKYFKELEDRINDWPDYKDVKKYRYASYHKIIKVIENVKSKYINESMPEWAILMAIDHDRIHFETSSVLIRQHEITSLKKPIGWEYANTFCVKNISQNMVKIPKGDVVLGKPKIYPYFGWDNEYGYLKVHVKQFYASKNLVSNKEFYEFVENKGYENKLFWSKEGWKWKVQNNIVHPNFWIYIDKIYMYRAMFDNIDMPFDWPAEVNYYEAQAFCNWKGGRIMSEVEFERMAQFDVQIDAEPFTDKLCNINLKYGSPCSVEFNETRIFNHVYGNVFQWLSTKFYPLPGFQVHYLYKDFSYPFFDEEHVMLKGGSWASSGASASKYYRLWFRKYIYQHAGFRVVKDA